MRYLLVLMLFFCAIVDAADVKIELKDEDRKKYISRAQVWKPVEVTKMNILAGPQNEVSVPLNSQVECEYVELKEQLTGRWPKFLCKTTKGHVVRVKYGAENKEIYAESLGTRLFWALGFYADEVYPVVVKCNGCPENPFKPDSAKRGTFLFKDAIIERDFPGIVIEEKEDQGWTWEELQEIKLSEGGASVTQLDALRLLAVFVQHADAKADNQRLACFSEDVVDPDGDGNGFCNKPVMMIQDLGATFGGGQDLLKMSRIDVKAWDAQEIFDIGMEARNRTRGGNPVCYGNLTASYLAGRTGLTNPIISDEGRKFLSGLLNQLTDKQIRDLFVVARVDQIDEPSEANVSGGSSIEDWVTAFKKKRKQVQEKSCPEPPQAAELHREE